MSKGFAVTFLIGLLVIGAAIWGVFYKQQGAHIEPKGSILKVRTLKLDDNSSAAVIEVRLTNESDYPLIARGIETSVVAGTGTVPGNPIAEVDLKDLFKNYPILGEQFNPVFKMRDQVPPHGSVDRELAAQFPISVEQLDQRKDLIVRVEDRSGPVAEMHERAPKIR